ncbi:hypothetical protein SLS54_006815 [Diplodia seriata]
MGLDLLDQRNLYALKCPSLPSTMPATFGSLCEDVLETICENLCIRDIMSLKSTNKATSERLFDVFRRIFENSPLGRTGIAQMSTSYHGLQMFHASPEMDTMLGSISSPRINIGRLTMSAVRSSLADCRFAHVDEQLLNNPLSWDGVESGLAQEELVYIDTLDKFTQQEWATAIGEDSRLLNGVVARLTGLRKVYIGKFELPPDVYANHNFFPLYKPGAGCELHSAALTQLFNALAERPIPVPRDPEEHPAELEELAIHREEGPWLTSDEAGIWALDIPEPIFTKLSRSLATVQRLHLTLSTGDFLHHGPNSTFKRNLAPAGFTKERGPRILLRFLSAMPLLSSLHLAAATNSEFSTSFARKVLRGLPATLSEIHLANMLVSGPVLAHFLNAHRRALASVGLSRLHLTGDASWTGIFRMLDVYLPRLRSVHLEQLWELQPDFADKVVFYVGTGNGAASDGPFGRRVYANAYADQAVEQRGVFVEGEWRPAAFRYDALEADDNDEAWGAVGSVRRGLGRALWGLHPEFSDRVFFFRPPPLDGGSRATEGDFGLRVYAAPRGSPPPGAFVVGEWRPEEDRYDVLEMNDEDEDEDVWSVREGLERAVGFAERETARYGSTAMDAPPLSRRVIELAAEMFGKDVEELQGVGGVAGW